VASYPIKAFWREDGLLTENEIYLLEALFEAHYHSCFRDNASSVAIRLASDSSGTLSKALIAALATLGGKHAPLEQTIQLLLTEAPSLLVDTYLKRGQKVPGWGGSFQGNAIDPIWSQVDTLLSNLYPRIWDTMNCVTARLQQRGKMVHPNPSAFTACVAIALSVPVKLAPYLFIYGRLPGWVELAAEYLNGKAV
jgi:citrate synthase